MEESLLSYLHGDGGLVCPDWVGKRLESDGGPDGIAPLPLPGGSGHGIPG